MSDAGDKLARSRLAIVDHIQRKERRETRRSSRGKGDRNSFAEPGQQEQEQDDRDAGDSWFANARQALSNWWRYHPLKAAVDLGTPLLASVGRKKPFHVLGAAAGVGALMVVARPWRLISLTGVLVALLKSPQVIGLVMSGLSAANAGKAKTKDTREYKETPQ